MLQPHNGPWFEKVVAVRGDCPHGEMYENHLGEIIFLSGSKAKLRIT